MGAQFSGEKIIDPNFSPPDCLISYLGAMTALLRARGIRCDLTDVAGMSGYAFIINIHPELLPTGPVAFDWEVLIEGTRALGVEVELVAVARGDNDEANFTELFQRVREEIEAGRPCIVWGAGDGPQFGLVTGYRQDRYVVTGAKGKREEINYDQLKAVWRIAAIFAGERFEPEYRREERKAVVRAVRLLHGTVACFDAEYFSGVRAFSVWGDAVARGRADYEGLIYNLLCYYELQLLAAGFCVRLAKKHPQAAPDLKNAAHCFQNSFHNLEQAGKLASSPAEVRQNSEPIAKLLRACGEQNEQAAGELERAFGLME